MVKGGGNVTLMWLPYDSKVTPKWPQSRLPCGCKLSREIICHGGKPQARVQRRGLTRGKSSEQWQAIWHRAQERTTSTNKLCSAGQQIKHASLRLSGWHARVKAALPNNSGGMSSVLAHFSPDLWAQCHLNVLSFVLSADLYRPVT